MRPRTAFSLVELLVVVGIVAVLLGVLAPAISRANDAAATTRCAGNLHQISVAFAEYASVYRAYPPNTSAMSPPTYWYDDALIGSYLPALRPPVPNGKPGGGPYVCPHDDAGLSFLSYAMNAWASSAVDPAVAAQAQPPSPSGRLWTPRVHNPERMLLVAEAYSGTAEGYGWAAGPTVGSAAAMTGTTTAGQRFGGGTGVNFNGRRFGRLASELCFNRHRNGAPAAFAAPRGRLNIAYADGHVAAKTDADLVTPGGMSTGDTCWSPADLSSY